MIGLLEDPKDLDGLKAALAAIGNPTTLQRVLALAQSESVDATVRQVKVIQARIAEVAEAPLYTEVETVAISSSDGRQVVGTAAPESVAPRNPGMGRR
jgi:hypothetical protein